jgi:hypothetical protein
VLAWTAIFASGGCDELAAFHCTSAQQCTRAGTAGFCESDGYCSRSDSTCVSGRRYVAAASLDGVCVGAADGGGPDGGGGPAGLIGYWPLDDLNGSVAADMSGQSHDASLHGTATFNASGRYGGDLDFSANSWLEVFSLDGAAFPTAGTVSLWFKGTITGITDMQGWGVFDNWDNTRNHVYARIYTGNKIQAVCQKKNVVGYLADAEPTALNDDWNHLVLSWVTGVGGTMTLTLNGASTTMPITDSTWTPVDELVRFPSGFVGQLDEVRLYDRALSASEVASIP